ncbi:MAG: ATP-binding cassette domain-containing protein, partial [Pseudomonadota bacterium]
MSINYYDAKGEVGMVPTDIAQDRLIAAEALGKRFDAVTVLNDVSLGIGQSEVVCVVGPSGSGKTTLLRCLALLEEPSEGRITMQGDVIASPAPDRTVRRAAQAVRSDIGMVFQHFNLWPHLTVLENIIEAPLRVRGTARDQAVAEAE